MNHREILLSFKERRISKKEALHLLENASSRKEPSHAETESDNATYAHALDNNATESNIGSARVLDQHTQARIAVIGMAGRFPGSKDLNEYWRNLEGGIDSVVEVDSTRWDVNLYYSADAAAPGKSYSKWAGLIDDVDCFDSLFFNISPMEAELMDPQQRLFLECAWNAIEDSGYAPSDLSGIDCGVFVGAGRGDYQSKLKEKAIGFESFSFIGNAPSILAARIAYVLNLKGASVALDTACSSSLVAIHQAAQSIRSGENVMALAGGISLLLSPDLHVMSSKAGMLSRDGRCKTFDEAADGFVPGEGVGAVVLKAFDCAVRDADHIYGSIVASGVNQDGSTNGITAPSADAQKSLECKVYRHSGIDVANMRYVECHGTGTKLGDPIEIDALTRAFAEFTKHTQYCAIGSVKANIGHTLHAAGIAGVIKVLLAMREGKVPPALHFHRQNHHIVLANTPFYVNTQVEDWNLRGRDARLAAVSSFGFSGTNAHIVLEKYVAERDGVTEPDQREPAQHIVVMSARAPEQLEDQVSRLIAFIDTPRGIQASLIDIAFTLHVGRDAMRFRLALLAQDLNSLKVKLTGFLSGNTEIADLWQGQVGANHLADEMPPSDMETLVNTNQLKELARAWIRGTKINWRFMYRNGTGRKIALPTYPFAKRRFWVADCKPVPDTVTIGSVEGSESYLWPELNFRLDSHEEDRWIFSASLHSTLALLSHHIVHGEATFPGCGLVELVLKAASSIEPRQFAILRDFIWLQPIIPAGPSLDLCLEFTRRDATLQHRIFSRTNGGELVYAQGSVTFMEKLPSGKTLDIDQLKAGMSAVITSPAEVKHFYAAFAASGVTYGDYFRRVDALWREGDECVGVLRSPLHGSYESVHHYIAPGMLDSALQCVAAFRGENTIGTYVPFSIGEITRYSPLGAEVLVYARRHSAKRFDVLLLDSAGRLSVECRDFVVRPIPGHREELMNVIRWCRVRQPHAALAGDDNDAFVTLLVRCGDATTFSEKLRSVEKNTVECCIEVGPGEKSAALSIDASNPDSFRILLKQLPTVSKVIFLAGLHAVVPMTLDPAGVNRSQECVEVAWFRLIKGLIEIQCDKALLEIVVLTQNTVEIASQRDVTPIGAGLHGFTESLAKEYPQWRVKCVDLDVQELADIGKHEDLVRFIRQEPHSAKGNPVAYRFGIRYEMRIVPLLMPALDSSGFRQGGVYTIIGGAGGLGVATTMYLVKRYDAQVIWIGRRAPDTSVMQSLDQVARCGKRPRYIQADIVKRHELEAALSVIQAHHPVINGLIHSAIVLRDVSIRTMSEADFRNVMDPKAIGVANVCDVFGNLAMDWMCFYSSGQSFLGATMQANYAAASTYEDAFARWLRKWVKFPVHIINWGYWGSVGVVATNRHRQLMASRGVGSLEAEEGMEVLECVVAADAKQVIVLKSGAEAKQEMGVTDSGTAEFYPREKHSVRPGRLVLLSSRDSGTSVAIGYPLQRDLESYAAAALSVTLDDLGAQHLYRENLPVERQRQELGILEKYRMLFRAIIVVIEGQRLRDVDGKISPAVKLKGCRAALSALEDDLQNKYPILGPHLALLKVCFANLGKILSGKVAPTEIIFPSSSTAMVEAIYKSEIANIYNEYVAAQVRRYAQEWLRGSTRERRLRILEIGAGTGATSICVFRALESFADCIEYVYSDVSEVFLTQARSKYASKLPHFCARLFDIERPLAEQGMDCGAFDIVIGSNVVHATKNVSAALDNIKATLKHNGLLILNEITQPNLLTTFTFGLLDGWRMFEDAETRQPDSPLLSVDQWSRVLADCGFEDVQYWDEHDHGFKQYIIVGHSDGCAYQPARRSALQPNHSKQREAVALAKRTDKSGGSVSEVERRLFEIISDSLKIPVADFESDAQFSEYGVDSILAVKLTERFNEAFEITLNSTDLFNYSNVTNLSRYISSLSEANTKSMDAAPGSRDKSVKPLAVAAASVGSEDSNGAGGYNAAWDAKPKVEGRQVGIAIIGMSGRFGSARSLDEFWCAISQGESLIREVPAKRRQLSLAWDLERRKIATAVDEIYCTVGGFMDDIDHFDAGFFQITGLEARNMDPQQRFFLEEAWRSIENAGYNPKSLAGTKCGVFAGVGGSDYLLVEGAEPQTSSFWGNASSVLAARIAYFLNLKGGALAIDTACSSSLVAIHAACQSLWIAENDTALAGGVFIQSTPTFYGSACRAGMLSRDGRCHTFDDRANGFVPGEGVGVCFLKRLTDAERDGDHIHGVVRCIGVNQDGTTNGITAPSSLSQSDLQRDLYEKFSIDPASIQLVEAHGTGTKLGDPIEIEALTRSFSQHSVGMQTCAIGSVKTNIGHAATAAGIAGVFKVLLAIRHGRIPPTINFEHPNQHIDFDGSPFYVNTQLRDWPTPVGKPRRAAVNSFGFSGTNAHAVIEEYIGEAPSFFELGNNGATPCVLVPLSAREEARLVVHAGNLLAHLERELQGHALSRLCDVAYTLQVGREEMDARVVFVVDSFQALIEALRRFTNGGRDSSNCVIGRRDKKNNLIRLFNSDRELDHLVQNWATEREFRKISELWAAGVSINWGLLHANLPRDLRRVSLPTYPFAPEPHWFPLYASEKLPQLKAEASRNFAVLEKSWIVCNPDHSQRETVGEICILSTDETEAIALSLADRIPAVRILTRRQLEESEPHEASRTENVGGVLDLTGLGEEGTKQEYSWLFWIQNVVRNSKHDKLRFLLVTSNLESFENSRVKLVGAERVGLFRSLQEEYARVSSRHIDVETAGLTTESDLVEIILSEWQSATREASICYRAGKRYVPQLVKRLNHEGVIALASKARANLSSSEVVWITGGTRGVGMRCAKHFATAYGAKQIVLMGKQPIPDRSTLSAESLQGNSDSVMREKIENLQWFASRGVNVKVITGDTLTERKQLEEEAEKVRNEMGRIVGVLHCAGSYDTENLAFVRKDRHGLQRVMRPKVEGTDNLCEVFAKDSLKFFLLFSSISAEIPALAVGQIDYSMANAYLDYAAGRYNGTFPICSLQWPNWRESGLGRISSQRYLDSGYRSHTDEEGLTLLDAILNGSLGPIVLPAVVDRDWIAGPAKCGVDRSDASQSSITDGSAEVIDSMQSPGLRVCVEAWLVKVVAKELDVRLDLLDVDRSFQEYGVDSILLAQLVLRVEKELAGVRLDPSIFINHPSIKELSIYLLVNQAAALRAKFGGEAGPALPDIPNRQINDPNMEKQSICSEDLDAENRSGIENRVAVVGMACHLPGAADIEAFWMNLKNGTDSITEVSADRWDTASLFRADRYEPGKSISKWGGFLTGIEYFDPEFFGISDELAPFIDPLERQWLEVSAEALADAGYNKADLWGHQVGVFVGARTGNFASKLEHLRKDAIVGIGQNFIAAHLAQIYNFTGPNLVVDTACASSLTAIHLAVQSLQSGESEIALAGGVDILLDASCYLLLSEARVLSPDGRCKAFDAGANGIGIGEGCGVLVLKLLRNAIRDGNKVFGVIDGSAINNDGNTMGITTPNPLRQQSLIEDAIRAARIDPKTVTYIETHGTGTMIGDPIELRSLSRVFDKDRQNPNGIRIGSVKSNFGHLLSASGAASIIKVLLSITHEQLPPTVNCNNPNPRFNFAESGIRPVQHLQAWRSTDRILRAGVSSFGFGGHNAHIIVSNEGVPPSHVATCRPVKDAVRYSRKRCWPDAVRSEGNGLSEKVSLPKQKVAIEVLATTDSEGDQFAEFFDFEELK